MTAKNEELVVPEFRDEDEKIGSSKKKKKSKQLKVSKAPSQIFPFKFTIIAIIILLFLPPSIILYQPELTEEGKELPSTLESLMSQFHSELKQETYYTAVDVLSQDSAVGLDLKDLQEKINSKLDFVIYSELITKYSDVHGWEFSVNNLTPTLSIEPLYLKDSGIYSYKSDDFDVVPGYCSVSVVYDLIAESNNKDKPVHRNILSFEVQIRDLHPFLEFCFDTFQLDASTPGGRIQRMVSYMLTTLVRHRLQLEYGQGPYESPLNVLNEGDVELAVNIALIFEQLSLLDNYDAEAVSAIDKYYISAREEEAHTGEPDWTPANPTGQRLWGSAELENFDKLYSHIQSTGIKRTLKQLLESSLTNVGKIDTADIFALYLILDREFTDVTINSNDDRALLDELALWDPRTPSDLTDSAGIKTLLNISKPFVLDFYKTINDESSKEPEVIKIEQEPKYLVTGKHLFIDGLSQPWGWYTDISLTTQRNTRTWGVPPSVAPPAQHDYRALWDLQISGEFDLALGSLWKPEQQLPVAEANNLPAYYTHDVWYNDTIKLDFPVTIYGWLPTLPLNNGISFYNLNPLIWDFNNDTWIQTPAAQIKEFFSAKLWKDLKPFGSILMNKLNEELELSIIHSASSVGLINDAIYLNKREEFYREELRRVYEQLDATFWENLELFTEFYLLNYTEMEKYQFDTNLWLLEDIFNITIDFSEDYQDVSFSFGHKAGLFELHFKNISDINEPDSVFIQGYVEIFDIVNGGDLLKYDLNVPIKGTADDEDFREDGKFSNDLLFKIGTDETVTTPYEGLLIPVAGTIVSDGIQVEHRLPTYSLNGQLKDISIRIEIFENSEDETELTDRAEDLSDIFIKASEPIFSSSDYQSTINEVKLRGYFSALTKSLQENEFVQELSRIQFIFNVSYIDNNGVLQIRELGLHITDSYAISVFMDWLSFSGVDLFSNVADLPLTCFDLMQALNYFGNYPNENEIFAFSFYILIHGTETYRISGPLESIVMGKNTGRLYYNVIWCCFLPDIHKPFSISHLKSEPDYNVETSTETTRIMRLEKIPDTITAITFEYGQSSSF